MKGEILSLETTQKLANYDRTIEYLNEELSHVLVARDIDYYNKRLELKEELIKDILKKLEGNND